MKFILSGIQHRAKLQPLVGEIGWAHNLLILSRCKDAQVRQEDENPSIGIILCKEKKRTIVEYALRNARKPHRRGGLRNHQDAAEEAEGSVAVARSLKEQSLVIEGVVVGVLRHGKSKGMFQ